MEKESDAKETRARKRISRKRRTIVKIAMDFLGCHDLDQLTLDVIAEEMGLTKNALYHYYNGKHAILVGIATELYRELVKRFQRVKMKGQTGLENIKSMGRAFWNFAQRYPYFHDVFTAVDLNDEGMQDQQKNDDGKSKDPLGLPSLLKKQQTFVRIWQQAVKDGIDDGSIRRDLSAPVIALLLGSMTSGLISELGHITEIVRSLNLEPDSIYEIALGILERGLQS